MLFVYHFFLLAGLLNDLNFVIHKNDALLPSKKESHFGRLLVGNVASLHAI